MDLRCTAFPRAETINAPHYEYLHHDQPASHCIILPNNPLAATCYVHHISRLAAINMSAPNFDFRGTRMTVSLSTADTTGGYAVIEMVHPPNVGPALHIHPRGPESFFIIEGSYTFVRGGETITVTAGQAVSIPAGVPHRYTVGLTGGRALVICPPDLENYFQSVAGLLQRGPLPIADEFAIAARYGQDFLDQKSHWGMS